MIKIIKEQATEHILISIIEALAEAISARNRTEGHSIRVASYAVLLAKAAGFTQPLRDEIRLGALLHDIGQLLWPDTLLNKQGVPLTEDEKKIIESHTFKGVELIQNWPCLDRFHPYILYHQEWIDGSGYPYGLQGEAIPTEVQLVSLADVYEALRHPRPYRKRLGYSYEDTIKHMSAMKGKRWKSELFELFICASQEWELTSETHGK